MSTNGDLKPHRVSCCQASLFPSTQDQLVAEAGVSTAEMRLWYGKGWLSFDPSAQSQYEEWELAEVLFIRGLAHSGLSDAMIKRLLSAGLEPPYCYDPSATFFSFFQNRWIGLPPAADPADLTDGYIDELAAAQDWLTLRKLQERINQALADAEDNGVDDEVPSVDASQD